jgi:hypothetical protein
MVVSNCFNSFEWKQLLFIQIILQKEISMVNSLNRPPHSRVSDVSHTIAKKRRKRDNKKVQHLQLKDRVNELEYVVVPQLHWIIAQLHYENQAWRQRVAELESTLPIDTQPVPIIPPQNSSIPSNIIPFIGGSNIPPSS